MENLAFTTLNFETDYRVLSLDNPFANGTTSYYHKSIGGYNGAKLKKYVELTEFRLAKELETLARAIQSQNDTLLQQTLQYSIPSLNMLNTKYILFDPASPPVYNPYANSPVWFVNNIRWVNNADEEILALDSINPKTTAVIKKMYQKDVPESLNFDTTATIKLVKYRPNHLTYETNGTGNRLAIFSEIYYKDGWNAYLDGKLSSYFPVDYILRGMMVPSGKHTVEFRFEPNTYALSRKISMASSIVLALFAMGILLFEGRKKWKQLKA